MDRRERQAKLVSREIARLAGDAAGARHDPIVAIGSTGTNRATAQLIGAIARAPGGAVVLPGLDFDLDDAAWQSLGASANSLGGNFEPSAGGAAAPAGADRRRARRGRSNWPIRPRRSRPVRASFHEALRPAATTEHWLHFAAALLPPALAAALDGVTLIEAADEREEALALAIALREVAETSGQTAALDHAGPRPRPARPARNSSAGASASMIPAARRWARRPMARWRGWRLPPSTGKRRARCQCSAIARPARPRRGRSRGTPPAFRDRRARVLLPRGSRPRLVDGCRAKRRREAVMRIRPLGAPRRRRMGCDRRPCWNVSTCALEPLRRLATVAPLAKWVEAHGDALAGADPRARGDAASAGEAMQTLQQMFERDRRHRSRRPSLSTHHPMRLSSMRSPRRATARAACSAIRG